MTTSKSRTRTAADGDRVRLRVPCSTSNLGPGFDLLGLCLDLFLDTSVELRRGTKGVVSIEVAQAPRDWPRGDDDLLVRALRRGLGSGALGWHLVASVASAIPVERGLGSSGAAVASGLLLGRAIAASTGGGELGESDVFSTAVEFEGHPDNALAALCGGCVLSLQTERGWRVVRQALHPSIGFAVAWPRARLATPLARSVLPRSVPFGAAVDNPRRLAALLEGLRTGDAELVAHGTVDHLHVQHRAPLILGAQQAMDAARAAGAWSATISGSGSTLIALCERAQAPRLSAVLAEGLEHHQAVEGFSSLEPVVIAPAVDW